MLLAAALLVLPVPFLGSGFPAMSIPIEFMPSMNRREVQCFVIQRSPVVVRHADVIVVLLTDRLGWILLAGMLGGTRLLLLLLDDLEDILLQGDHQ